MSFEPTKVIEMNKGKQIGNTLMQDASNIPYNNTNVKDELDTINSNLSDVDDRQDANKFGTTVGLAPGNSYTTPSDGYAYISFGARTGLSGAISIKDANGTSAGISIGMGNSGNTYATLMTFVKKGMQLTLNSDATASGYFIPLQ